MLSDATAAATADNSRDNSIDQEELQGNVVKLVDTMDLKSIVYYKREGSNPSVPIIDITFRIHKYEALSSYDVIPLHLSYIVYHL